MQVLAMRTYLQMASISFPNSVLVAIRVAVLDLRLEFSMGLVFVCGWVSVVV